MVENINNGIQELSRFLNQISLMQAYNLVNNSEWVDKSNGEKIVFLHRLNFSNEDIATIIGTTLNTVRKEISVRKD